MAKFLLGTNIRRYMTSQIRMFSDQVNLSDVVADYVFNAPVSFLKISKATELVFNFLHVKCCLKGGQVKTGHFLKEYNVGSHIL